MIPRTLPVAKVAGAAWVAKTKVGVAAALPVMMFTYLACVAVAWVCLRFYDIPVRRWLARRNRLKSS